MEEGIALLLITDIVATYVLFVIEMMYVVIVVALMLRFFSVYDIF